MHTTYFKEVILLDNIMWPQVVDYISNTISLPVYCLEYNYQPQEEGEGGKGGADAETASL